MEAIARLEAIASRSGCFTLLKTLSMRFVPLKYPTKSSRSTDCPTVSSVLTFGHAETYRSRAPNQACDSGSHAAVVAFQDSIFLEKYCGMIARA